MSTVANSTNIRRSLVQPISAASGRRLDGSAGGLAPKFDRPTRHALYVGLALSLLWMTSFAVGFKTILGVLTAAGFALAIIGLKKPLLGVLGIGIICSLDSLMRVYLMTGGLLRYNTFNYLLYVVILIALPIQLRQKDPQTRLLQGFTLLLAIEMLVSPSIRMGILHMMNLVSVFGLLVYFYRCRRYPHVWYMLGITVGLMSAMTGFAFLFNTENLSYSSVDELAYLDPDYRDPNFIDPNALGYVYLTGIFSLCIALSSVRRSSRSMTMPLLALLAVNFCWIVLVGSRGSMLVASSCLIYVLASLRSNSRRFKFAVVAAVGVLFILNFFPQLLDRSIGRVNKLLDNNYTAAQRTSARSDLAVGAWRLFLKHPLGVGTGGYKKSWARLEVDDLHSRQVGQEKAAHSAWLKTLAENGVPGFILFSIFVFSFAYFGIKQRRRGAMPIGILVTVILSCAFISTEFQSKGIWFIVAATIIYLHHRYEIPNEIRHRSAAPQFPSSSSSHHRPATPIP